MRNELRAACGAALAASNRLKARFNEAEDRIGTLARPLHTQTHRFQARPSRRLQDRKQDAVHDALLAGTTVLVRVTYSTSAFSFVGWSCLLG
ncbi:hypothetical protein WKW80_22810 [Variovorax humicola]|uniref:Uncharacterized protein n=1 Tax=Variovorax humicola TaxID=1769758 RepID=A0ABU8W455_9BURK